MGHRKWIKARSWREFHADDMIAEHNVLYDAWRASEHRVMETLDENNRLDRELDEARKRIAELEAPTRMPFTDAQIERMAGAFWKRYMTSRASSADAIRAALAAGGLEPCAVPEYDPDDVALAPTGTVLRNRLVEAEAKIERQRAELEKLNHLRQLEAGERGALRDELEATKAERDKYRESSAKAYVEAEDLRYDITNAVRNAMEKLPDAPWKDKTATEAVWLLSLALRAQPSSDTGQLTDAQVEALARVLREAWGGSPKLYTESWRNAARAAIAHLSKRPEGLPTRDDLARLIHKAWESSGNAEIDEANFKFTEFRSTAQADAVLTALRPWLRDPVGWELDVTWQEMQEWLEYDSIGMCNSPHEILNLCRSRIKPVLECKECAKKDEKIRSIRVYYSNEQGRIDAVINALDAARAALEGE